MYVIHDIYHFRCQFFKNQMPCKQPLDVLGMVALES